MFFQAPTSEKSIEQIIDDLRTHSVFVYTTGEYLVEWNKNGLRELLKMKTFLNSNEDLMELNEIFTVNNFKSSIQQIILNDGTFEYHVYPLYTLHTNTIQQNIQYNPRETFNISNVNFKKTYFETLPEYIDLTDTYKEKLRNLHNEIIRILFRYNNNKNNIENEACSIFGRNTVDDMIDLIQSATKITRKVSKKKKFYINALTLFYS